MSTTSGSCRSSGGAPSCASSSRMRSAGLDQAQGRAPRRQAARLHRRGRARPRRRTGLARRTDQRRGARPLRRRRARPARDVVLRGPGSRSASSGSPTGRRGSWPARGGGGLGSRTGGLARELEKTTRKLGTRPILRKYGEAVQELTPLVLCSPSSVVDLIEPGVMEFDLVIFDEASQITVPEAVGALGRARAAIVVGDSKQMPPTRKVGGGSADDDEIDDPDAEEIVEDQESILSECELARVPTLSLNWHYRSQDEALIAFSNRTYYRGDLSSFPTPTLLSSETGLEFRPVHWPENGDKGMYLRAGAAKVDLGNGIVAGLQHQPVRGSRDREVRPRARPRHAEPALGRHRDLQRAAAAAHRGPAARQRRPQGRRRPGRVQDGPRRGPVRQGSGTGPRRRARHRHLLDRVLQAGQRQGPDQLRPALERRWRATAQRRRHPRTPQERRLLQLQPGVQRARRLRLDLPRTEGPQAVPDGRAGGRLSGRRGRDRATASRSGTVTATTSPRRCATPAST